MTHTINLKIFNLEIMISMMCDPYYFDYSKLSVLTSIVNLVGSRLACMMSLPFN